VNVSRDISLYRRFIKRLTKSLCALAASVIQLSEFDEGYGADTADSAWAY
jgi:hypothetical protein